MENLLKTKRLEKKLTLEQVGEMVGVGKSTVRKWENGMIENMGRDKIVALSKALNVSPLDILGIDKPKESTTKQILDSVFSKLNEPRQEKVVNYAKSELDEQNKVVEISDYQIEKEYPYYDDAVSAGTGQYIGISQRETITLPVEFDADYVVPVYGDSMEPEYHDGDYIFIESTVNLNDGEIGVFELYGETYVKRLILEDDHAYLHSLNKKYKDMKVDADSDFRVLGRVVGRYSE
ncbi:MAG: XRE family transcriptional regulator [Enterococcus faecalis]|nr:XRE family transcriptional regulator [Enterococcus faecalis]